MKKYILPLILILTASACTHIQVNELDRAKHNMELACIHRNHKVAVSDFLSVMEEEFRARDIKTSVYVGEKPAKCEYTVEYTARRSWDVGTFLSSANIQIYKDQVQIASADYRCDNGFNLTKYDDTRTKMTPVYRKLFSEAN